MHANMSFYSRVEKKPFNISFDLITFRFVNHVNSEGLQDLRLDKVSDPALGKHRDRHGGHDLLDQLKNGDLCSKKFRIQ